MTITPPQVSAPSPGQFPSYYEGKHNAPYSLPAIPQQPTEVASTKKREWGAVFNTAQTEGSLRNGLRPETETDVYGADAAQSYASSNDDEDYDDFNKLKMTYRRADGGEVIRKLTGDD